VGAVVPLNAVVARNDNVVVTLELVRAYPNGFVLEVGFLSNPRRPPEPNVMQRHLEMMPRIGVRFSDGRRGTIAPVHMSAARDQDGLPTEVVVAFHGGGGGSHGYHMSAWVHPLPSPGTLEVFFDAPASGIPETRVIVDGDAIRAAASAATVVWE
jgi:hypothetical protein